MTPLHLIYSESGLSAYLSLTADKDAVVLLGDSTYCSSTHAGFYVLADDAKARGIAPNTRHISYAELVELVTQHSPIVSWST
jgi:sulfur relay protein TusB/DsrH